MFQSVKDSLARFQASLQLPEEEQLEAQIGIETGAAASFEYLFFILLSAVVATLGLVTASNPVIIGAMVLAPLMNPVLGVSMGVVRGDLSLLGRGIRTLLIGLGLGLLVATISTFIMPELPNNQEILGRTRPTLFDLFIGMAAGAGGALGQARKRVAGVLPGAAIAVSLMPPLCVTGIGLAEMLSTGFSQGFAVFYGSALLWMANLAAINLAALSIFVVLGFRKKREGEAATEFRRQVAISGLMVALLTVPLVHFLSQTVTDTRVNREIREMLRGFAQTSLSENADLVEFHRGAYDPTEEWTPIFAVFRSPRLPDRDEVIWLRASLEARLGGPVELNLTVNPVHVYEENPQEGSISDRPRPLR